MVDGVKDLISITQLLPRPVKTKVLCDNQGSIFAVKNRASTRNLKHINLRINWLHEQLSELKIELEHVSTDRNLADLFTKPLNKTRFVQLLPYMLLPTFKVRRSVESDTLHFGILSDQSRNICRDNRNISVGRTP